VSARNDDHPLDAADLAPDPVEQFSRWYTEAEEARVPQPEAMSLATAAPGGAPSLRMVLLKAHGPHGFEFFTNLESRKARELDANPSAALLFFWQPLGRQVRIEGDVTPVNRDEVERYARTRSPDSRLSALASPQSRPVESREWLEERVEALRREHGEDIPVGDDWGGYRLVPGAFEFWQNRSHRLHDRFRYLPEGGGWRIDRLGP
jgi:pyridoxamine 5'-phosphate oxidase